ncbi:hypothetical protein NNRS527_00745 [Nitrosospira sp. NRS527]|nr:hypothetical protein NNRS527_00745 [Nitrosospira sp. NRS527]
MQDSFAGWEKSIAWSMDAAQVAKMAAKMAASTRVGSQSRLMNYLGLNLLIGIRFDLGVVLVVSLLPFFRWGGVIARGKF